MKLRSFRLWPEGSVPVRAHATSAWLFAFDRETSSSDLLNQLGHAGRPVFEVSALGWIDDRVALMDLGRMIAGPNGGVGNWDALGEGLGDLPEGAIIVVRDIDPRQEPWLGKLVGTFDPTTRPAGGAQVLALEGWGHPNVELVTPTAWQVDLYEVTQLSQPKHGPTN